MGICGLVWASKRIKVSTARSLSSFLKFNSRFSTISSSKSRLKAAPPILSSVLIFCLSGCGPSGERPLARAKGVNANGTCNIETVLQLSDFQTQAEGFQKAADDKARAKAAQALVSNCEQLRDLLGQETCLVENPKSKEWEAINFEKNLAPICRIAQEGATRGTQPITQPSPPSEPSPQDDETPRSTSAEK